MCIKRLILALSPSLIISYIFIENIVLLLPITKVLQFSYIITVILMIIPPISGFFQPFIGYFSDTIQCNFGKRKPFIIIGEFGILIGLIIRLFMFICNCSIKIDKILFITSTILINISLQFIQAPLRFLICDLLPKEEHIKGNLIFMLIQSIGRRYINFFW